MPAVRKCLGFMLPETQNRRDVRAAGEGCAPQAYK